MRQRPVPRRWRTLQEQRRPRGAPWLSTRIRRVIWLWQPWALLTGWFLIQDRWYWSAGMLALAFVTFVLRPAERPPRLGLEHTDPAGSRGFLDTMIGVTGVDFVPGNRIDILNNGDAFYPAMLAALRQARRSICIEQYIFWAGETAEAFCAVLAERARAGVQVKLLLDAVGSATLGERAYATLSEAGCQIAWYTPIRWYTVGRFNNRTHRKTVVVDGRVGFTGGAGIADHWRGTAQPPDEWRDMMFRLEGPAVGPLLSGFAQNWLRTTGEIVQGEAFFPPRREAGPLEVQVIHSSPDAGASSARLMYYLAIVSARRRIDIVNPYFVPDETAIDTLVEAVARGVQVRVLMTGRRTDNWLARQNSRRLYGVLLDGGVRLYEYHHSMLHQKVMLVDGCWCTVGTSNFDNRSFAHNEETSVCVCDTGFVAAMTDLFEEDLAASQPVAREDWQRRSVLTRGQELLASLLKEQV
ncbi:cardiolipin synthase B [Luteitalea sp. TBR-22]|uniref:phospholipase D-like domain-containing protein n=1 Tax=Luteitalea sp. TBR-22 TaxID=2802971 RepID=UPI001AF6159D|nr:phospholipase D-like domain-containing protein [Luteitalea sp. TBR-22]BCS32861.1 cardiolipin synthase B [Luteitalea sp. TBR-22]